MLGCFLRRPSHGIPLAFVLMLAYEYALHNYGLATYIFYAERKDFLSANREGLCSLVGYLAL